MTVGSSLRVPTLFGLLLGISFCASLVHFNRPARDDRNWNTVGQIIPYATIEGNEITIFDYRNFSFYPDRTVKADTRITKIISLNQLDSLWFIKEDFGAFDGFAHTMLSFGLKNGEYVCFSVEARREADETYSGWRGLWRTYELMIQVGDERDFIGQRTHIDNPPTVYLYPVPSITSPHLESLFISLLEHMNSIYNQPEWYNTLTSNCTNTLYRHAEYATGINIPVTWNSIMPGYSDKVAYRMGIIPNSLPFQANRDKYRIDPSGISWDDPEFSQKLRVGKNP